MLEEQERGLEQAKQAEIEAVEEKYAKLTAEIQEKRAVLVDRQKQELGKPLEKISDRW